MEIKRGTVIGAKKIIKLYWKGPFAYVDTQCQCQYKTITMGTPLGQLLKGLGLTCQVCYQADLRAAVHEAAREAKKAVWAKRKAWAESVRQQFKSA